MDSPGIVSHVADFNRRYPGERVTWYTRLQASEAWPGFTLQISLPEGLLPGVARASNDALPQVVQGQGGSFLLYQVAEGLRAGDCYEYQVETRIAPTQQDAVLESRAVVTLENGEASLAETATVTVTAHGRYLKYLPALYQKDELMGRLLMLFESFWAPLEEQIGGLSLYFDPRMTPPDFLPWLASWLDLALDERWPEERRRLLLRSAASLYRQRGTRRGLQDYLEIYTGERAEIIERRANNLRLGPGARLGPGVALGTGNEPHTFTVSLRLPPEEDARREEERHRMLEAIIEAEKPAHTGYTLELQVGG